MKQTELFNLFEDGISKEKLRKIEMRKDALMILKVKQKYDSIAKRMESPIESEYMPIVKLKDGRNLFDLEDYEIENINYIYELKFQERDYLRIKALSLLPELCKLEVKFSNIWLPDIKSEPSQNLFFANLQNLDLCFNNLNDEALHYIKTIKALKTLNLMGNQLTHEIPDLSELVNLKELNLSSNNIVSYFLNLNIATNNFTEHDNSQVNNNTNVSHFNIMLSGKDFNNEDSKKKQGEKVLNNITENIEYQENISHVQKENLNNNQEDDKIRNPKVEIENILASNKDNNSILNSEKINYEESKDYEKNIPENDINENKSFNLSNMNIKNRLNFKDDEEKEEDDDNGFNKNNTGIEIYEEWQKFLKTNLQEFYHKLAALKNLKTLNLSHNKIHFFDIDPYYIQKINGFSKLNTLDISFNFIKEEISILLVMNIPNLNSIDITCNPITRKKKAYENIEYEIFKTKNILLINSKPYDFTSNVWEPHNKINFTRRKVFDKTTSGMNQGENNLFLNPYKVNSEIRIEPVRIFNKKVENKIKTMLERRKKIDEEFLSSENPQYQIDILQNLPENLNENMENDILSNSINTKDDKKSLKSVLNSKKNKENIFLTNADSHINKLMQLNKANENNEGSENYISFLTLANKCFGKEKHYKSTMPISKAYQKLRFILNNLPSSANENFELTNRYMKPTISRSIYLEEYKPDNKNFKKEFKIIKEINKQQIINESNNEENHFNTSRTLSSKSNL